ncbi:VOC family protein [Ligilactobacillus pobuzihii]|uniref:VOC family protein n=1 Tax=Ligilactobacillus pobuzihii TaxID=449659 RepID=UPI0019D17ACD|nr:VOC family protein [Ligilactobacillus pobuzihii]MBN7274545.1 VOC family protein [Ligilactobacillus pobuzihii]
MKVSRIDHIVLPVKNLDQAFRFYHEVFDMQEITAQRTADTKTIRCGHQLICLHQVDRPLKIQAADPTIGSTNLCIVVKDNVADVLNHLKSYFVEIVDGPIKKIGSEGEMTSIYIRDYDKNLLEVATYSNKSK